MPGPLAFAWLFPVFLGLPAVIVEGEGDCPAPAAVSAELAAIMTLPDVEAGSDRVVVSNAGGDVNVRLLSPAGALLGERRVSAPGTCEEKARAAAVILAAWLTDVHPEFRAQLPEEPAPAEPEAPAPEPAPPETPPPEVVPPVKPPPPVAAPPSRPPHRFSFAAAAGVGISSLGATPALELSVRYAPPGSGFGALVFALASWPLTTDLGTGSVSSFRWPLGAGPLVRLAPGGTHVDLSAGATVGWLHLSGKRFDQNDVADDIVAGAFFGASVSPGKEPRGLRPYASAGLLVWPGTTKATASNPDAELDLPRVEGTLLLGAAL